MKNIKRKFMAFLLTLTMLVTTSTVAMAAEVEPLNDKCGEEVTHMFDGKNVQVLKEIEVGVKPITDNYEMIVDRKEAIKKAIQMAQKGDSVIIAGKGHENYQILGDKTIHFDDAEVAKEILGE